MASFKDALRVLSKYGKTVLRVKIPESVRNNFWKFEEETSGYIFTKSGASKSTRLYCFYSSFGMAFISMNGARKHFNEELKEDEKFREKYDISRQTTPVFFKYTLTSCTGIAGFLTGPLVLPAYVLIRGLDMIDK